MEYKEHNKRNGKTQRNHPFNHISVDDDHFIYVDEEGQKLQSIPPKFSINKKERWETIENQPKLFYSTTINGPVKTVYNQKTEKEIEQELQLSQGGRQKRKEIRQQIAQQQTTLRKTRQRKFEPQKKQNNPYFVAEQIEEQNEPESIAESESEEDQNQKEYIRIISDHLIPREKAITKYRQYENFEKLGGNRRYQQKGNKKARWEDLE